MNAAFGLRVVLKIMSILVCSSVWGQVCSSTDPVLLSALRGREDFVRYLCSAPNFACPTDLLSGLIETAVLHLTPPTTPTNKKLTGETEVFCRVLPSRKGSQFPTLIFSLRPTQAKLIAEDWERGLKILRTSRNGRLVLEGRALIEPQTLERYLLEWNGVTYEEYCRTCFRVELNASGRRETLRPVVCE